MPLLEQSFYILLPYVAIAFLVMLMVKMVKNAKKGKSIAFAIGAFMQMFIPDPKAQQTIEAIAQTKEKEKKTDLQRQKRLDDIDN